MDHDIVRQFVQEVREKQPLIHNITNAVVTNFVANGLLSLGASPVMAYEKEEVADMAKLADALVLNIGTLTASDVEAMLIAGKSANRHNVPVVFDPVGAGATPYRTEVARRILNEIDISVLRANAGEVASIVGESATMKGVDSGMKLADVQPLATQAANRYGCLVVITGEKDIVTDGTKYFQIENGDQLLTKVTGAGCLLSSVVAAFITVGKGKDSLQSIAAAVTFYGLAAERAVSTAKGRPGSFQIAFIDELNH